MSERWLTTEEAAAAIRAHVGCSIGRSQAILADARASREVRFEYPDNRVRLWADDGIVDARPPILIGGTKSVNEADLLDWLSRQPFPDQKPAKPVARRTPPEQARALKAMKALYGRIPPQDEVSNPVLEQAVNKHLKQEGLREVKKDAIQRAAGRRR